MEKEDANSNKHYEEQRLATSILAGPSIRRTRTTNQKMPVCEQRYYKSISIGIVGCNHNKNEGEHPVQNNATDRGVELLIVFLEKLIEGYNPLNGNRLFDYIAVSLEIDVEQLIRPERNTFTSGEYHGD